MNSSNFIGVNDDTKFQDVIPEKVPGNTDEATSQFANAIIDNNTVKFLKERHLTTKKIIRRCGPTLSAQNWINWYKDEHN